MTHSYVYDMTLSLLSKESVILADVRKEYIRKEYILLAEHKEGSSLSLSS